MADNSFCYMTRPASNAATITTMPKYRGTKTQAEVYAEVAAQTGASPAIVAQVIQATCQSIIDNTIACWKIEPLGDGLIGFLCGCGGSSPIGQPPPNTFEDMSVELRGYYGAEGRDRAAAAFTAQNVGNQNRVAPVFNEVYDSETKTPNHLVANKGLTIILGNRNGKFDPTNPGHFVKFRKGDGTFVMAAGYPYIKGNTIVVTVPAGLVGPAELHLSMELNGSIREGIYPFQLT